MKAAAAGTEEKSRSESRRRALDLENYVPYFINMISHKLSRGSSRLYLRKFGIGVIEWRVLSFLKIREGVSANEICQQLAIDKAATSRALQELEAKQLVGAKPIDRRQKALWLTPEGRTLHDRILPVALEREQILLSSLSSDEVESLLHLLRKLRSSVSAVNDYEPSGH